MTALTHSSIFPVAFRRSVLLMALLPQVPLRSFSVGAGG
jgi:hypothetical protein